MSADIVTRAQTCWVGCQGRCSKGRGRMGGHVRIGAGPLGLRRHQEGCPRHRRLTAALGAAFLLLPVLIWSRGDRPGDTPAAAELPAALGAIQPRLSPDGGTVAFSYQGEI